jgi:hypothetical protein
MHHLSGGGIFFIVLLVFIAIVASGRGNQS